MLHLGTNTIKEVRDFFGIKTQKTFTRNKEFYLTELEDYYDFECRYDSRNHLRSINITAILLEEEYAPAAINKDEVCKFLAEEWGKYDEQGHSADSLTIVTNRFCNEHKIPWDLPKYIEVADEYTNKDGKTITKIIQKHNPEIKLWWKVYNIIHRAHLADNKQSRRLYMAVNPNKLQCIRLTEQEEEIIYKLAKKNFSKQFNVVNLLYTLKEIADDYKYNLDTSISFNQFKSYIPELEYISKHERWNSFIADCEAAGIGYVIKGCDRTEKISVTAQ